MNSALKIMWKWGITLKYMSNSLWITTSTWRSAAILNFVKKKMFRSGETLGLFTGNKGGHNEHFLKFSALYYFFPFQNLKFLDYWCIKADNDSEIMGCKCQTDNARNRYRMSPMWIIKWNCLGKYICSMIRVSQFHSLSWRRRFDDIALLLHYPRIIASIINGMKLHVIWLHVRLSYIIQNG